MVLYMDYNHINLVYKKIDVIHLKEVYDFDQEDFFNKGNVAKDRIIVVENYTKVSCEGKEIKKNVN